jgi:hypothetical protein
MFRLILAAATLFTASLSSPVPAKAHPGLGAIFGISFAHGLGQGLGTEIGRGIGDLISPRSYGYYNAGYQVSQVYGAPAYSYGGTQAAYAAPECSRPASVSTTVQYAAPATTVYSAPMYSTPIYSAPVYSAPVAAPVYAAPYVAPAYAAPYYGYGVGIGFGFGFGRGGGFGGFRHGHFHGHW